MEFLPRPAIIERRFDDSSAPCLQVLSLRWNLDAAGVAERTWHLPQHLSIKSPAPERFGIAVEPGGEATFRVRVVWDELHVTWERLTANQLMRGSLTLIVRALGNDLWQMMERPAPLAA
jgi:hypothetical protein